MPSNFPFTEVRPWGEFRQLTSPGELVTVKTILVKKGQSLSLQYHHHRSEFWKVLSGTPEITKGEEVFVAKAGDEVTIALEEKHRVRAIDEDVLILEIARGTFDENDITRLEDAYGRA